MTRRDISLSAWLTVGALAAQAGFQPSWAQSAPLDPSSADESSDETAETAGSTRKIVGWLVKPTLAVREAVTDNARLTPQGGGDLVTTVTPGIDVEEQTRRLRLSLAGSASYDLYARHGDLDGYRYDVNANGWGEAVENYLFVDLRAVANTQPITNNGVISAFDRTLPGNQTEVFNGSVSPYLQHDFGGWAVGELRYRATTLDYSDTKTGGAFPAVPASPFAPSPSAITDANTNEALISLRAGPQFTNIRWSAAGSASDTGYAGGRTVEQRTASATGEYALTREVALLAVIGEDSYKDSANGAGDSVHPSWRVGGRFSPGPRTDLLVEGGSRYGGPYWSGRFRYRIGKALTLSASHQETVTTQQQLLGSDLNELVRDEDGHLVDSLTGDLGAPNAASFNYTSQSFTLKTSRVGLNGGEGRNSYTLSAELDQRALGAIVLGQSGTERQQAILATASYARQLTRQSDLTVSFSLGRNYDSLADAGYNIQRASVSYDINLSPTLRASAGYQRYELSNAIRTGYAENALLLTLRKSF